MYLRGAGNVRRAVGRSTRDFGRGPRRQRQPVADLAASFTAPTAEAMDAVSGRDQDYATAFERCVKAVDRLHDFYVFDQFRVHNRAAQP
jgi:hypothetical protein